MENKGKHFLDLLQLYITCVAFGKNDLITVKSAWWSRKYPSGKGSGFASIIA